MPERTVSLTVYCCLLARLLSVFARCLFRPVLACSSRPRPFFTPAAACIQRRKELDKEAVRAKRGAYQAYDDEEFEGEIGPGAKRKVRVCVPVQATRQYGPSTAVL